MGEIGKGEGKGGKVEGALEEKGGKGDVEGKEVMEEEWREESKEEAWREGSKGRE